MADNLWKALLAEFIGTFTLVFVGASAVALTITQGGSILTSAFAFGLALLTIIYIWGPYSGAHVNPAVSFGFAVAGQMNWGLMLGYWIAQLLGGIAAAALVAYFFGTATGAGASVGTLTNSNAWKAVLMEAFLTFFLVIAYLFIYRNPMLAIVSGIVIGLTLAFCIMAGGYLTGGSTNPARSLGPALFSNNMGSYWIYIVGPLLGALVAVLIYKLFTIDYSCCYKVDECGNRIKDECGNCVKVCKRPLVDNCGRPIMDCGKQKYEEYVKVDRKYGFTQETPMKAIGEWMSEHGFDPRYLKQEFDHHKGHKFPLAQKQPTEIVETVIESITVETAEAEIMPGATEMMGEQPVIEQIELIEPTNIMGEAVVEVQPVVSARGMSPQTLGARTMTPQGFMARTKTVSPQGIMSPSQRMAVESQGIMSPSQRIAAESQGFASPSQQGFMSPGQGYPLSNSLTAESQGILSTAEDATANALSSPFQIPRF